MAKKKGRSSRNKHVAIVASIVFIVFAIFSCWYFLIYSRGLTVREFFEQLLSPEESAPKDDETSPEVGDISQIATSDFSVHFIAPEVKASGDCTLVKVGNTEVLIDAGPTQGNAAAIKEYLTTYCTDGTLEYVIATHADTDHIAGFVGTKQSGAYNGILYSYKIGTIISFDRTNKEMETSSGNPTLYARYVEAVEYAQNQGTAVYTALQCWNNSDGAQRSYYLDDEQKISMSVLYNYYYEHDCAVENNYSVCLLFTRECESKTEHYLFTGDLEEDGEASLVQDNVLPHVTLYKAGHHGSKTSSTNALLEVITPENVVVCCCAGYNEYGASQENVFPTQAFIDRVGAYTSSVYVTIMWDEANGFYDMNGDVVFYYDNSGKLKLWCSHETTLLKDTQWFKNNRTWGGS